MNQTIRILNKHFHIHILLLIALLLSAMFKLIYFEGLLTESVIAERYAIAATLIVIPLALKLFNDQIKKAVDNYTESAAINRYKNAFFRRLYLLSFVAFGNIVLYAVSQNMNFMWLTVIILLTFIFCRASADELQNMMPHDENVSGDD